MPVAWQVEAPWREGVPSDGLAKGPWWTQFGDPQLDALEEQALANSPTLVAANARLLQARALVAVERVGALPAGRHRQPRGTGGDFRQSAADQLLVTQFRHGAERFHPEPHGQLRIRLVGPHRERTIEGARASAEQSAADLENTRLLLTTDLATAYFNLRELDIELDVLARSIALQKRVLELVTARHDLGAATGLEVAQQQALLDSTLTQVDVLRKQRSQFEHAIATLTGTPAPLFALAPDLKEVAAAADSAGRAVGRARTPAGRRLGRARDGGGQCADRRRQGGVLSEHHHGAVLRRRKRRAVVAVQRAKHHLVAGRVAGCSR